MSDPGGPPQDHPVRRRLVTFLNVGLAIWFLVLAWLSFLYQLTVDACEVDCARLRTIGAVQSAGVCLGLTALLVITTIEVRKANGLKRSIVVLAGAAATGLVIFAAGAITFGYLVDA